MTGVIDYWCNLFTPEGIRSCFTDQEELREVFRGWRMEDRLTGHYFPELRIVGAHTGWPWVEELIALAWKHRHVYIGTSAHAPRYWDPSLVRFLNSRGIGKVLFGTDYPVLRHADALAQVGALNLKDDARAWLLRETARKVFKL